MVDFLRRAGQINRRLLIVCLLLTAVLCNLCATEQKSQNKHDTWFDHEHYWTVRAAHIQSIQFVNFLGDGCLNNWLGLGQKTSLINNDYTNSFSFVLDSNIQYMLYGNGNYIELALMGKVRYTFRDVEKKVRPFIELGGGENFVFRDNDHKGFYPMVTGDIGLDIKAKEKLVVSILGEYSATFQRDDRFSPGDLLDSFNSHFSISVGLTYSFYDRDKDPNRKNSTEEKNQ